MQPIDNSDLAWLIIADFLADQGKINESEELRDLVNNPETDTCGLELRSRPTSGVGGFGSAKAGGVANGSHGMVGSFFSSVGGRGNDGVGSGNIGACVGGCGGIVLNYPHV